MELSYLGYANGVLGKRAEAMEVLKELEARYARRESPAMFPAGVYAGLGERDQAFSWLEKDFQAHSGSLALICLATLILIDDPRYADLLGRMGFR
jgi:hypothetical protein